METASTYKVPQNNLDLTPAKKLGVMRSLEFQVTSELVRSLVIGGALFESHDELIDEAIALREKLIEKVGGVS